MPDQKLEQNLILRVSKSDKSVMISGFASRHHGQPELPVTQLTRLSNRFHVAECCRWCDNV